MSCTGLWLLPRVKGPRGLSMRALRKAWANSAFWGWNDVWLSADFENWTIEREIEAIRCPLLAIQGIDDEYGTLAQIHGIARRLPQTELLELADCGHSAHRDQPEAVIAATVDFLQRHRR